MKYLLLSLILLANLSFAADAKKKSATATKPNAMKELGKIDEKTLDLEPNNKKEEIAEDTALVMKPSDVKVNFACKTRDGHEIKQGQPGYDECLQKLKNDKHNPHEPSADLKVDFKK